MSSSSSLLLS
jgi:serine/threonine protein kinase